jgi:hypothetical protein
MKWFLFIIFLIAPMRYPVMPGPAADTRPLISPKYFWQQEFADHGLLVWEEDHATASMPIPVDYILSGQQSIRPTHCTG